MRWDRGHRSRNVDDRRAEGPVSGGGGGLPVNLVLAIASRFGWKGILVGIVIVGAIMYGGRLFDGGGSGPRSGQPSATSSSGSKPSPPAGPEDELAHFV